MPDVKKKQGRPTKYTEKLATEICETIAASSESLMALCNAREHWPTMQNLRIWISKYPEFRDQYVQAKRIQVLWFAEETLSIADDSSEDVITSIGRDGEIVERPNTEFIQRSKLRVDTRKWHCSKLMPKLFGETRELEQVKDENDDLKQELLELRTALAVKYRREY